MNGDSKSTYERVHPWLARRACRADTRDFCSALAALVSPVQYIFFLPVHFNFLSLIAQQARQAAVLGRLSLGMCLWKSQLFFMYQYKQNIKNRSASWALDVH
jgi:hypothetical protein